MGGDTLHLRPAYWLPPALRLVRHHLLLPRGEKLPLESVLGRVREIGCPLVEVTGGEPLIQPGAFVLVDRLLAEGFTVLVETAGSEDLSPLDPRAHVIMDLKCPGSGESARNRWENLDDLDERDEIKFVVADRADYEWTRQTIEERGLARRVREGSLRAVLLSPVWGGEGPGLEDLSSWILEDRLGVRIQTQLHKHIWEPNRRGV